MDLAAAKLAAEDVIRSRSEDLLEVSHRIFDHPELCYEEQYAHDLICDVLEGASMTVERGAFGLATAFVAYAGSTSPDAPTIAVVCEYDALPGIGHACGHNIIAAAGVGAALGAAAVAEQCGGRLVVLGTPAEEGGGGKVAMIEAGAFEGLDAAMMVHPADADLDSFWAIAVQERHVEFHGRAAHAAAAPQRGLNALDAAVLAYNNIAALRQHIGASERIHGIFTHGGDKPNVVPHYSAMQWYVRAADLEALEVLKPRVVAALQAGALATGCEMMISWPSYPYDDLVNNSVLTRLYAANAATLGRVVDPRETMPDFMGSTDMGNVSHVVPSIHPMIKAAPAGTAIHTADFAVNAAGDLGDRAVIDGAIAMARTVVDLWMQPEVLAAVTGEFAVESVPGASGG